ncbi:MAG TPA: UDP-N-acetylmuramate dehydrogenase, partial [Thermodesulfobacteriota bacterium]|nr:UDP-N-acetylmuramate dehydrogenase [Thermodesulfobacteriota bacterium]
LDAVARALGRTRRGVPLAPLTTFRIGGPAELLFEARDQEALARALATARTHGVPARVLAGGSNVLVDDRGLAGLVVLNRAGGVRREGDRLTAGSGLPLAELLEAAAREGLSGLEFAAGIPGSVGGAVYGNAGAYGKAMEDVLVRARLLTPEGEVVEAGREELGFAYRTSALKGSGGIVLEATFALVPGDRDRIRSAMAEIIRIREAKHPDPVRFGSAGSYFKNLPPATPGGRRTPAGLLLDQVGAKGMRVGRALVSEAHANFLVNPGGATAADVLELARRLKALVRARFGVELEEEVLYLAPLA